MMQISENKGFTLLEIVVSLGILSLGILGIFSLIPTGVDQSRKGQEQGKAVILAQSKLEDIISKAAENWTNYANENNHYKYLGSGNDPLYFGPNDNIERINWGWEENTVGGGWIEDAGYQWEWHFIGTPNVSESQALISLTVSWPQKWSKTDAADKIVNSIEIPGENKLHDYYKLQVAGSTDYFKKNNIQYVRLISYVSKGL